MCTNTDYKFTMFIYELTEWTSTNVGQTWINRGKCIIDVVSDVWGQMIDLHNIVVLYCFYNLMWG